MVLKYTLSWVPMIFIAIANGAIRQFVYGPQMSELSAHQISCATAVLLFFVYALCLARLMPLNNPRQALGIGLIWVTLTVAFEFCFGLFIAGHSLERLLHDYNLAAGRLWPLVLVNLLVMPYIVFRIKPGK